jgi:DNA replication protein DnaC
VRGAAEEVPRVNAAARAAVIAEYLKALKLPAFATEYQGLARQARDGGWDYEDFLRELLEVELHSREERTAKRRLKEARFPDLKTLEQIDWEALGGVSKQKILELATCEYVTKAQDVVLAGPIGTGKTHVAISLGVEAARRRFRVAFFRAAELVRALTEARDERTLTLLHRRLRRVDLLILDELGFVPFERAGGELLFDLLSDRHEARSTMVTTNLSFGEWVQVFGDEKLTTALLDRLGHHAHVLTTRGSSYRTRKRKNKSEEEQPMGT